MATALDYSESLNTEKEKSKELKRLEKEKSQERRRMEKENSQELKRLADKLDSKLSEAVQQTLAIGPLHSTLLEQLTKVKIVLVGSSQDGSKVNTPYDAGDVDIILIATDKLLSEPLFRYVKDHPASLWVPAKNKEHAQYFIDVTLIEGQYVPVSVLRHIKKDFEEKLKADINRKVQHGIYISEDRINTIQRSKVGYTYESMPTGEDKEDTDEKDAVFEKFLSADIVPAFSFKGWPFTAEEWTKRKREWPSEEVVKKVIDEGCQIIAKRPLDTGLYASIPEFIERHTDSNQKVDNVIDTQTDENDSDQQRYVNNADKDGGHSDEENVNDGYFRLSFSQCERILVESLSELQVLCWRVLKAYQKAYFETQPQVLKSYHWKTVVFWFVEETKPTFWKEENFMNAVLKMLEKMIDCLEKRFLPLYFVRMQNLITTTSEYAIKKTIKTIQQILEKPIESLRQFLENPPKPITMMPEPQRANLLEKSKPVTPLDFVNEILNDARLFSGNTEEVIDLLKSDAQLLSRYKQVVSNLLQDTLSQATTRGPIQIGQENPPVANCAIESRVSPAEKHCEHMEDDVKRTVDDTLHQLKRSSTCLLSKPQQDIIDLLKETLAKANNRGPIKIEHENPSAKTSATEIPESQKSSQETQRKPVEFDVKNTFGDALYKLTRLSNSEEKCHVYQFNNVISESEIPILESLLQLAGESVKMLLGGEEGAADPAFGRTLVRLMIKNQKPEACEPNDAHIPFELGDIKTNMKKAKEDYMKKKTLIKEKQCNNKNNTIQDNEIPTIESILQSACKSLKMPDGGETRAADQEFAQKLVESMKQNQNTDGNMIDDMEGLMAECMDI
ncbi:uncharacterized protein LOC127858395 [Dreissena polymorpha]|uniref:Mab-21-like nucleotidyltransferase domain-containing protein n=1 Tax=Dreissena polymorpha TaxID=45954 RepID=A0A9D3YTM3_DREPO|nr:uncharacterized protein LOC127858395 [Dreissena polymorpha]KAH3707115.1 hypothetical protein DPMN_066512 [Dreissena polymorpha]